LEDLDAEVDIKSVSETIRQNLKISTKESLDYYVYELEKHKPWFDRDVQKYYTKGNKLNCRGYRIQVK
jgi:hypothetical protein